MKKQIQSLLFAAAVALATVTSVEARHTPRQDYMDEVASAAHDLEEDSAYLLSVVQAERQRYSEEQNYSLNRIKTLTDRARQFEREVERNQRNPERTEDDYESLRAAYNEVVRSFHYMRGVGRVRESMNNVNASMSRVIAFYEGQVGPDIDWRRLESTSDSMEGYAIRTFEKAQAEFNERRRDQSRARRDALEQLRTLRDAADRFDDDVEAERDERIEDRFRELVTAYRRAGERVNVFGSEVRRNFEVLSDRIRDCGSYLRGASHDDRDRDRYPNRDHRRDRDYGDPRDYRDFQGQAAPGAGQAAPVVTGPQVKAAVPSN